MPLQWKAKSPGEVIAYEWAPELADGDGLTGYTLAVTAGAAVIDSAALQGDVVIVYMSGGAAGETAILTATGTTNYGEELEDAIYLPIRAKPNAFSYTVANVLNFAMRPIVGLGGSATAAEQQDARENLDDMLASWAEMGADLQVKLPTAEADVLYVPDYAISAIKAALRVRLCGLYGKPVDMEDFRAAQRGLQQVKMANLPTVRESEYF